MIVSCAVPARLCFQRELLTCCVCVCCAVQALWRDTLTGSKNQMGFMWLWQVLMGSVPVNAYRPVFPGAKGSDSDSDADGDGDGDADADAGGSDGDGADGSDAGAVGHCNAVLVLLMARCMCLREAAWSSRAVAPASAVGYSVLFAVARAGIRISPPDLAPSLTLASVDFAPLSVDDPANVWTTGGEDFELFRISLFSACDSALKQEQWREAMLGTRRTSDVAAVSAGVAAPRGATLAPLPSSVSTSGGVDVHVRASDRHQSRPTVSNYSCARRELSCSRMLAVSPLQRLLDVLATEEGRGHRNSGAPLQSQLPFDLSGVPAASSRIGQVWDEYCGGGGAVVWCGVDSRWCAVLCCAVLCCAVLCCAVLCCAVLCCAVLCCGV